MNRFINVPRRLMIILSGSDFRTNTQIREYVGELCATILGREGNFRPSPRLELFSTCRRKHNSTCVS
jgi:hypothetical protein